MSKDSRPRLAILYPGDRAARAAFGNAGVAAVPAVYHDDFRHDVLAQLQHVDGVLVWHNPIEGGRDRSVRGAMQEVVGFEGVLQRIAPYFEGAGRMIDQAWQARRVEGMTRAYPVRGRVAGFGHQSVVALHPPAGSGEAPLPSQRLYSDAEDPRFQDLRQRLEGEWLQPLCARIGVRTQDLPILWDADFLLGERDEAGPERYVLCEINVSSVSPFPDSAIARVVEATCCALGAARGCGTG